MEDLLEVVTGQFREDRDGIVRTGRGQPVLQLLHGGAG